MLFGLNVWLTAWSGVKVLLFTTELSKTWEFCRANPEVGQLMGLGAVYGTVLQLVSVYLVREFGAIIYPTAILILMVVAKILELMAKASDRTAATILGVMLVLGVILHQIRRACTGTPHNGGTSQTPEDTTDRRFAKSVSKGFCLTLD